MECYAPLSFYFNVQSMGVAIWEIKFVSFFCNFLWIFLFFLPKMQKIEKK